MKKKYSITAVSYLNTKPFLYGLLHHPIREQLDLQLDIPSACAEKLQAGTVDIGLVPVAIIPSLQQPHIISDYCIGTNGTVKTVGIYSQCPIEEIENLYLDFHSRTSAQLTRILIKEYWKLDVNFLEAKEGFREKIVGKTAALVIGDRTIGMEEKCAYQYDLGEAWRAHTGLPFIFAAWVSNKPLSATFIKEFNDALAYGCTQIPNLALLLNSPHPKFDIQKYYTEYINYDFDLPKKQALALFLKKMGVPIQESIQKGLSLV